MNAKIDLECPYCGTKSRYSVPFEIRGIILPVLCDCEDAPGCDCYFAVRVDFNPTVTTYALREMDLSDVSPTSGKSQEIMAGTG